MTNEAIKSGTAFKEKLFKSPKTIQIISPPLLVFGCGPEVLALYLTRWCFYFSWLSQSKKNSMCQQMSSNEIHNARNSAALNTEPLNFVFHLTVETNSVWRTWARLCGMSSHLTLTSETQRTGETWPQLRAPGISVRFSDIMSWVKIFSWVLGRGGDWHLSTWFQSWSDDETTVVAVTGRSTGAGICLSCHDDSYCHSSREESSAEKKRFYRQLY